MAVVCVTGIVTRYVNYRESDRILSIFTIEQGRVDAKARGCRRPTSPLLPAAQPFVYGEFELFQGKDKYTVNQCSIQESFFPIREDIARFAVGSAMLQLAHEATQEREGSRIAHCSHCYIMRFPFWRMTTWNRRTCSSVSCCGI